MWPYVSHTKRKGTFHIYLFSYLHFQEKTIVYTLEITGGQSWPNFQFHGAKESNRKFVQPDKC